MPFMVIYRTSEGTTRYEQADAIDEAAHFVERLRNTEGTDDVRIFRMEEISFAFRPYYKVELGMQARRGDAATTATVVAPVSPAPPAGDPPPPVPLDLAEDEAVADAELPPPPPPAGAPEVDAEVGTNGSRRGLFGR